MSNFCFLLYYLTFVLMITRANSTRVDVSKCLVWGPGLHPHKIVLPARYFFVQSVDHTGNNITESHDDKLEVKIESRSTSRCRIWKDVLDRKDGSYIVRYKLYEDCSGLTIDIRFNNLHVKGFPLTISENVLRDICNCPQEIDTWLQNWQCPDSYRFINEDLQRFQNVDMDKLRDKIISKFNKKGSMSLCHYVVVRNQIHRKCYGQHVGFHIFMDAILLSITRKLNLPDVEFFMNLGDWPLENTGPDSLPIFSWCGSDSTADIILPTYDITESTLECMGRVQLDMLSVQGNSGPRWQEKQPKAFWRGRDSRMERLQLIDIARSDPELFNVSLTNFFFFRDKEEQYGPKQPHVSFFEFFEYKYQLGIDGTVAPYRLPYLLAGGGLLFKQESPYYEHFYRDLVPGVHYVPINRNLSNLVQQIKWAKENDKISKKMALEGATYARENLLPTHIFCYHVLLFNDWSKRLRSDVKVLEGMEAVPQHEQQSCRCPQRHTEL